MGRIKSLMVKRAAKQLMALEKANFSPRFEDNKKILSNKMPSKSVRNKIAGYLSRLTIAKQIQKQRDSDAEKAKALPEQLS